MQLSVLILFIVASGFVMAALLGACLAAIAGQAEILRKPLRTPSGAVAGFTYLMFAGPYLVARNALKGRMEGRLAGTNLAFLGLLALLWSFCSGVLVLQTLAYLGLVSI